MLHSKNLHWYYSNIYFESPTKDLKNVEYSFIIFIQMKEKVEIRDILYFFSVFFFNEYLMKILYKICCININIINF